MEKLITLSGVSNIVNKLVSYIKRVEAKALPEPKDWVDEDANNYKTTGIYHFKGYRYTNDDNLPITNYNPDKDTENIAFTLIVDAVEGYVTNTSHIPGHISQVLMLGNRKGSETKIYTRNATIFYDDQPDKWESWKELVSSVYLGVLDSIDGETINKVTEIGLYTGAVVNVEKSNFDVFKLEVINNYAVADLIQQTNHVLQTITVLSIDGSEKTLKRTGIYNGNGYTWNDWKSIGENIQVDEITIEETMDDLITLDFIDVIQNGDDTITDENNLILTI